MDPVSYINFNGPDWTALKLLLERELDKKMERLVNTKTHEESQEIRGAIKFIQYLLKREDAAKAASTER